MLSIDVEDSGPAIPETDLAQIFEPFFTTKPAGTGLGLAIAKGAAIAHGGDLHLSQNRNGCVKFSMALTKFCTEPGFEREQGMGKVLIVDDEPSMRRIVKANLRQDAHIAVGGLKPFGSYCASFERRF